MAMRWVRLYTEIVDDARIQRMPAETFRFMVNLWCVTGLNEGSLPPVSDIAFRLRIPEKDCQRRLHELSQLGLVDCDSHGAVIPHNWHSRQYASDHDAAQRKKRSRSKSQNVTADVTTRDRDMSQRSHGNVTASDTDAETDSETDSETEPDVPNETRRKRPAARRNRNAEMVENVAGLMEQYFDGKRPKPDLLIATRVHDALGNPCTWERIVAFKDFISNKLRGGFMPEGYGIFLSWAEMVARKMEETEGGGYAASGD